MPSARPRRCPPPSDAAARARLVSDQSGPPGRVQQRTAGAGCRRGAHCRDPCEPHSYRHPSFSCPLSLILGVEGRDGCSGKAELFPDTGYVGRRNLYQQASGGIIVLGQYDARVIEPNSCTIRLVEFQSLVEQASFVGAFDVDAQKRWRYLPSAVRAERPFEKR